MRNSILYDRGGRKKDESLGPVSKTGARAITHDRWVGRAFPEGPTGRGEEMGFGGEGEALEGSVWSGRGGQEVVDHDKGHTGSQRASLARATKIPGISAP